MNLRPPGPEPDSSDFGNLLNFVDCNCFRLSLLRPSFRALLFFVAYNHAGTFRGGGGNGHAGSGRSNSDVFTCRRHVHLCADSDDQRHDDGRHDLLHDQWNHTDDLIHGIQRTNLCILDGDHRSDGGRGLNTSSTRTYYRLALSLKIMANAMISFAN